MDYGGLVLISLRLAPPRRVDGTSYRVTLDGEIVDAVTAKDGDGWQIEFDEPLFLEEGAELRVELG